MRRAAGPLALLALYALVAAVFGAGTYTNPVVEADAPDPGVIFHGGKYYAATTTVANGPVAFPIRSSVDLVNWAFHGYAFQQGRNWPTWTKQDFWAPEIHHVNGQFVLYYAVMGNDGMRAVGAAVAPSPVGPYKDIGGPLAHNGSIGYIDPTFHQDSTAGKNYLYWKSDGNAIGKPTVLYVRELDETGTAFAQGSTAIPLLRNDLVWEDTCIEAPWVVERPDGHYLFYSGNMYDSRGPNGSSNYAVGVARSRAGPTGPFVKKGPPILHANLSQAEGFTGPGHCSVVAWSAPSARPQATRHYMVYHAWGIGSVGGAAPRHMLLDRVSWQANGWPAMTNGPSPSNAPEPAP